MLTIEALKNFGANTEEGLGRCLGREDFYLRLTGMALNDKSFAALKEALEKKDLNAAFDAAHALKGVLGNLSLTPLYQAASELTERLRPREDVDCTELLNQLFSLRDQLLAF